MIVSVIDAKYIDGFKINILLNIKENDSTRVVEKVVDMSKYLQSKKDTGVFSPLKDLSYFKNFTLNSNTIEWENGADIAPERFLEI